MLHDVLVSLPPIIAAIAALVVAIRGNNRAKRAHIATKRRLSRLEKETGFPVAAQEDPPP